MPLKLGGTRGSRGAGNKDHGKPQEISASHEPGVESESLGIAGQFAGFVPVGFLPRVDDRQVGDAVIIDRPADRSDIPAEKRLNQNDPNIGQRIDIFRFFHSEGEIGGRGEGVSSELANLPHRRSF